jgi:radical SAM superfamily enzyme YgiQ (UPF0313 family)
MRAGIFAFSAASSPHHAKRDKRTLPQGAHIVRQCCLAAGHQVADLCDRWDEVDVLMVSLYWWEHLLDLINLLASEGIEYDRRRRAGKPLIFVGGGLPSYNPSTLREIADLACIGDGEEVAPAVLSALAAGATADELADIPGVYVSDVDNCAEWQQADDISATIRWPYRNEARICSPEGVQSTKSWERRLELARGCRRKCAFCGVGWTKRYRENSAEEVSAVVSGAPREVKTFAPDLMAHSGWPTVQAAYEAAGRYNQARDISTRVILRDGFRRIRSYSTGIDGLSARIRSALCKPLSADQLVEVIVKANAHMGSLGCYLILGLPGETSDDCVEWFETLARASAELKPVRQLTKKDIARGFTAERFCITATLNAFCPTPHTPLQWAGIDHDQPLTDWYMSGIDILGPVDSRPLRHKLLGRAHGPLSRVLESAVLRGGPELHRWLCAAARLRRTRWAGPAGLDRAFSAAARLGVADDLEWTLGEKSPGDELPWARRVKPLFSQDVLAKAWLRYNRRMGRKL